MKNGDILKLFLTLEDLEKNKSLVFKIKTAYVLAKNKEALRTEAQIINKLRSQILTDYGTADGKGSVTIQNDKIPEVNQKINELMDMESEVKIICLPIEAFDENELNMEQMSGLMPMIQDTFTTGPIYEENPKV